MLRTARRLMLGDNVLRRLPEATNSWRCKWFWLICYLCIVLVAMGATVIPGIAGIVAIAFGLLVLIAIVAMREGSDSCPT